MNKKVASASSGGDQPPFNPKDQSQKKPDTSQQRVSMPSRREFLKVGAPATVGSGLAAASGLGLASSSAADCKLRARPLAINPWSDLVQTSRKWLASAILALFSVLFTTARHPRWQPRRSVQLPNRLRRYTSQAPKSLAPTRCES